MVALSACCLVGLGFVGYKPAVFCLCLFWVPKTMHVSEIRGKLDPKPNPTTIINFGQFFSTLNSPVSTGYLCTALVASVVIGHVLRRLPFLVRVEFSPIFLVACGCFVIFVGLPPRC